MTPSEYDEIVKRVAAVPSKFNGLAEMHERYAGGVLAPWLEGFLPAYAEHHQAVLAGTTDPMGFEEFLADYPVPEDEDEWVVDYTNAVEEFERGWF